jgi:hypothetical protein
VARTGGRREVVLARWNDVSSKPIPMSWMRRVASSDTLLQRRVDVANGTRRRTGSNGRRKHVGASVQEIRTGD